MDLPSTGWVTVLAGLLARGSLLCVPAFPVSQWPSSERSLAAYSCGGSHGLLQLATARVPSFLPGCPGNQHGKMFPLLRREVKRTIGAKPTRKSEMKRGRSHLTAAGLPTPTLLERDADVS